MRPANLPALGNALARRQYGSSLLPLTAEELSKLDLSNKSSLTTLVIAVPAVCVGLITTIVSLRLILRRHTIGHFLVDDYLIMLASIFTIVVCSVVIAASNHGLGKHIWNMDLTNIIAELSQCIRYMFVANIFYALAISFTKLSILSSYFYIFAPQGVFRILMYATGTVTTGLGIASVPATIFECLPVHAAWDFTYEGAKCYTFVHFLYASTAISVLTDLILCVMPIPLFWRLQLPLRQKLLISALFFLGGFACVASIVRLAYLHLLADPLDVTYDLVSSVMWTIAECTIGIVCVSLPPLRSLLARTLPGLFHGGTRSSRSGRTGRSGRRTGDEPLGEEGALASHKTVDVIVLSSVSPRPAKEPPKYAFHLGRSTVHDGQDHTGVSVTISAGASAKPKATTTTSTTTTTTTTATNTVAGSTTSTSATRTEAVDQMALVSKESASMDGGWDGRPGSWNGRPESHDRPESSWEKRA